jgi:hypothetical protein
MQKNIENEQNKYSISIAHQREDKTFNFNRKCKDKTFEFRIYYFMKINKYQNT